MTDCVMGIAGIPPAAFPAASEDASLVEHALRRVVRDLPEQVVEVLFPHLTTELLNAVLELGGNGRGLGPLAPTPRRHGQHALTLEDI